MNTIDIKKMNYDELVELIKNANLLLESKKQEKERNEIKETIMALFQAYFEKGGDREELLSSLTSSVSNETKTNSEIEGMNGVVLIDKEHFNMGKDKVSDFKIEEVLNRGFVNQIIQEGNTEIGRKNFPDPEISRVVSPRGIAPCLTTNVSCVVNVKELEGGESKMDIKDSVTVQSGRKKAGRKGIPILQFTLDGDFVKEWESASVAEVALGKGHQSIGKAVRGENDHKAGDSLWYRKNDPEVMENIAA
jgi:hypothetical protein